MKFLLPILIIAALIFVLSIALGYACFLYSFVRRKCERADYKHPKSTAKYGEHEEKVKKAIAEYDSRAKEDISIISKDGLRLYASYIEPENKTEKLVIAFHGYRSSARADFSPVFRKLLDNGCSLLLVEQRCHRRSEGKYIGFGVLEAEDVALWCDHATARFGKDTRIYLYGVSMGAASVTMASHGLPPSVKGIIADCGYSSPRAIVTHVLKNEKKIPTFPTVSIIDFLLRIFAGYSLRDNSSTEAIKKSSLPFLIIHGALDRYVPTEMAHEIYNARPENTELLIVDGAKHARSHLVNEELYLEKIIKFLNTK